MSATSVSEPLTVAPTRSLLFFGVEADEDDMACVGIRGRIQTGAGSVTFNRLGTGCGTVTVSWQVLEFASGVNTRDGNTNLTNGSATVQLTAVDPARSFVLLSANANGSALSGNDMISATLSSDGSQLSLSAASAATQVVSWQVAEITGANVTRERQVLGSTATSALVMAATPGTSPMGNFRTTSSVDAARPAAETMAAWRMATNSLEFFRAGPGEPLTADLQLVHWPAPVQVYLQAITLDANELGATVTMPPVDVAMATGFQQRGGVVGQVTTLGGEGPAMGSGVASFEPTDGGVAVVRGKARYAATFVVMGIKF